MKSENQQDTKQPTIPKSKSGIIRLFLALFFGGGVLLVGAFFIGTSSWFITDVVLPAAGGSLNSKMEASNVSGILSSSLEVNDFKLTPDEEAAFVSVKRLSVAYDLMAIAGGTMVASDLTVDQAQINLVMKADGSLNIDPIMEALSGPKPEESAPLKLDLQRLKVADSQVQIRVEGTADSSAVYEVTGLSIEVDRLANNSSAEIKVTGEIGLEMNEKGQPSRFNATLNETLTVALNGDLLPTSFETVLALVVGEVTGAFSEFANNRIDLSGKLSDSRLDPLRLAVSKSGGTLGSLIVAGPLNLDEGTADLEYSLTGINENLLNQFKDLIGFGFGTPSIGASGGIKLSSAGQSLALDLLLDGKQLSLSNSKGTAPPIGFNLSLAVAADLAGSVFSFPTVSLNVDQGGRALMSVKAEKPLTVSLSSAGVALSDAKVGIELSDLNLSDWQTLLGEGTTGRISSSLTLASEGEQGSLVNLRGSVKMAELVTASADELTNGLGVNLDLNANIRDMKSVDVPELNFTVNNAKGGLVEGESSLSLADSGLLSLNSAVRGLNPSQPNAAPVNLGLEIAGNLAPQKTVIQKLALKLPATSKASNNTMTLSGEIVPDALQGLSGQIRLASKSLDLTPLMDYMDQLSGPEAPQSETTPAPTETESRPNTEPEPLDLPVNQFNATVQMDQLFAREIAIKNWLTEIVVRKNDIALEPLSLTLNDADIKGHTKLDFSVPGYRYDIALETAQLPAGPLIGSFDPSKKGVYDGMIDVGIDVNGAGMTGLNLRKNLKGAANLSFKGANIELFDSWKKLLMTPIALVLRMPGLLDSPIQGVEVNSSFGEGSVSLDEFKVTSPQFHVVSTGNIPIADDLMASALALPVDLVMKKEMAVSANLVNDDAEETDGFVTLPPFVKVEGSLAEPAVKIDKLAVGKLFIRNVAGLPESVVGQAGQALQGLGGLVGGNGDEKNAAGKLIEGVGGLIGGEKGSSIKEAGSALRGLFNRPKKEDE